jgi:hypothetical protein
VPIHESRAPIPIRWLVGISSSMASESFSSGKRDSDRSQAGAFVSE